ncbi:MAG: hypothetical protein ACLU6W_09975 [Lachnospiraceae bacterium]
MEFSVEEPRLWSPEDPVRYRMTSELYDGTEKKMFMTQISIRTMRFDKDMDFI